MFCTMRSGSHITVPAFRLRPMAFRLSDLRGPKVSQEFSIHARYTAAATGGFNGHQDIALSKKTKSAVPR